MKTLYELQLEAEREQALLGKTKFEEMVALASKKHREETTIIGLKLMNSTYTTVKSLVSTYVDNQMTVKRKSALFKEVIVPAMNTQPLDNIIGSVSFVITQTLINRYSNRQYVMPICIKSLDRILLSLGSDLDEAKRKSVQTSVVSLVRHIIDGIDWLELKKENMEKGIQNYIEMSPEKHSELTSMMDVLSQYQITHKPMLVKPKAHKNLTSPYGGYLLHKSPLLKHPVRHNSINEFTVKTNPDFFKAVNSLQEEGYQINKRILEALPVLAEAGIYVDKLDYSLVQATERYKAEAKQEIIDINNARKDKFGDSAYMLTEAQEKHIYAKADSKAVQAVKLYEDAVQVATEYSVYDAFYFPVFADNRARWYYYPSCLSPQGNELHKALLQFKRSRLMDDETINDSFVALANSLGHDKMTIEYRIAKAKEVLPTILKGDVVEIVSLMDSETALTGLAVALDIKGYFDAKERGEAYYTHQPLHVDSCNSGSQINGLLLRDERNCRLSNIINVQDLIEEEYLWDKNNVESVVKLNLTQNTINVNVQKMVTSLNAESVEKLIKQNGGNVAKTLSQLLQNDTTLQTKEKQQQNETEKTIKKHSESGVKRTVDTSTLEKLSTKLLRNAQATLKVMNGMISLSVKFMTTQELEQVKQVLNGMLTTSYHYEVKEFLDCIFGTTCSSYQPVLTERKVTPSNKLEDTYLAVALLLKEKYEQSDNPIHKKFLGFPEIFNRKVFKKSSMIRSNYNAGFLKCAEDIKKQLKDNHRNFWDALTEAERKIFVHDAVQAVDESLPASNNYKAFAKKVIREVVKRDGVFAYNHPLTGFPVVLRENKVTEEVVKYRELYTGAQRSYVFKSYTKELDLNKTVSSTIPSVIHSIDSAILAMVKKDVGSIPMATIHDSIGALAGDVSEKVLPALRKVYYYIANANVLDSLVQQLEVDVPVPYSNTLDVEVIKESKHLYS